MFSIILKYSMICLFLAYINYVHAFNKISTKHNIKYIFSLYDMNKNSDSWNKNPTEINKPYIRRTERVDVQQTISNDRGASKTKKEDVNQDGSVKAVKVWQSGYILADKRKENNNNSGRYRSDPWWMRDEEKNNPRIRPTYKPWWRNIKQVNMKFNNIWKVNDLRQEAIKRGLITDGLKADLIERLNDSNKLYSLSDDNFTLPIFVPIAKNELNKCYPEVYEGSVENMEKLRLKINSVTAPE